MKFKFLFLCTLLSFGLILSGCKEKQLSEQDYFEIEFSLEGLWQINNDETMNNLSEGKDIYTLLGSLYRETGSEMILSEGNITYYAGGLSGTGSYEEKDGVIKVNAVSMNDSSFKEEFEMTLNDFNELVMPYANEIIYWSKIDID